jgi:import receptor subunit TOM70
MSSELCDQVNEIQLNEDPQVVELNDDMEELLDAEQFQIVKNIDSAIAAKEEGNVHFRNKDYDESLESYSRAIEFCPETDEFKDELATFYGNRSAAYFLVEEYELVVEDCTDALKLKANYVKVLVRRMQAFEKLDKVEEALSGDNSQ